LYSFSGVALLFLTLLFGCFFSLLLLPLYFLLSSHHTPLLFLNLLLKFGSLSQLLSVSLGKLFLVFFLIFYVLSNVSFVYFARAPKDCTTIILLALLQIKGSAMLLVLLFYHKGLTEALILTMNKLVIHLEMVE
jgi:hypothetical protein